jgi:hypothetical protein
MAINSEHLTNPTIPYPDFQNNQTMDDYLFDENNQALLQKLTEIVTEINTIKDTLLSSTVGDSGAKNIGVSLIEGLDTTNIQTTLEALKNDINSIIFNNLPSASITTDKLAFTPLISQTNFNQDDLGNVYFNYIKTTDPTSSDNASAGYKVGDKWTNTTAKTYFRCIGDGLWESDDTLSTAVATLFGLVGSNATMRNAMSMAIPNASYMLFCTSTNAGALDVAFGKNNTDRVTGIGLQMSMYAWYKGDSRTTYPFATLQQQQTLANAVANAYTDIRGNKNIIDLISLSPYAYGLAQDYIPMSGDVPAYQSGTTYSYRNTTTTGTSYHSVTITRSGVYKIKATVVTGSGSGVSAVVRKNNVSLGSAQDVVFSQDVYLVSGDVIDIYVTATSARDIHISPILLYTKRPVVLPSTVNAGTRVVQAPLSSLFSNSNSGTAVTFSPITKAGTYRLQFIWGGGTESGGSYVRTISVNKNGTSIYTESYGNYSYGHVISQDLVLAENDVITITWTGNGSGSVAFAGATLSITANDTFPA